MALTPDGMTIGANPDDEKACVKLNVKEACSQLSLEGNRKAAILFLNLAQTLHNQARPSREATLGALEAATASFSLPLEISRQASFSRLGCYASSLSRGATMRRFLVDTAAIMQKFYTVSVVTGL